MTLSLRALLLSLGLIAAFVPTGLPETVYARVGEGPGLARLRAAELGVSGSPEFVEADGELFVRDQRDWGSLVFDYGKQWSWSREEIADFRRRHPELEPHWEAWEARQERLAGVYGH